MSDSKRDSANQRTNSMEFLAGVNGPIIPNPTEAVSDEQISRTQSATDFLRINAERIKDFKQRVDELGRSGEDTVITLINVDDPTGKILADVLMPGHDWQSYRDAGEVPVARGLATKDGVQEFLQEAGYTNAAAELLNTDDLRVVVIDSEVALVIDIDFAV